MADQFDIVDIVYNAVEPASTGFILYKDQSGMARKEIISRSALWP